MMKMLALSTCAVAVSCTVALASPGVEIACADGDFEATIGFDIEWKTAYIETSTNGEISLPSAPDEENTYGFADGDWKLGVSPPVATLSHPEGKVQCYQTEENVRELAFYGEDLPHEWKTYAAVGEGWFMLHEEPNPDSPKIGDLGASSKITILENADHFEDGHYWFKIEFRHFRKKTTQQGYVNAAWLCRYEDDEPQLVATVRKCHERNF
ncbi:MAG: SH3 domain-containing protein [Pseudomonadota bacterium]